MDENTHPLLTKRMLGALGVLVPCAGIGLTLMSFTPFILRAVGMLLSALGAIAAAWIYFDDFRRLRLRLVHPVPTAAAPLSTEQWIVVGAMLASILLPAFVWLDVSWPELPAARHLTANQKTKMEPVLVLARAEKHAIQIFSSPNCDECEDYAQELRDFFNAIPGWEATGSTTVFAGPKIPKFEIYLIANEDNLSEPLLQRITAAFSAASIPLVQDEPKRFGKELDAVILINRRRR